MGGWKSLLALRRHMHGGCHGDRFRTIMDVVIASCVDGYNDTSTTYRIDIPTQWETVVSKDVIFDEDVRSSSS
jgi:hypothetical protein